MKATMLPSTIGLAPAFKSVPGGNAARIRAASASAASPRGATWSASWS